MNAAILSPAAGHLACERCGKTPTITSRRFRCTTCQRLVCSRCCQRGGHGQTGAHRWAQCFECEPSQLGPTAPSLEWRKTSTGGFTAWTPTARYAIYKYRATSGARNWSYVLRINGSAETSPATPHADLVSAKRRAEQLALGTR